MMALPQRKLFTQDEYLFLEEKAETKHELVNGEIYAMAGATENHVKITGNIFRNIANHLLESSCDVYSSDMKLSAGFDCYYPDVFVKCDPNDNDQLVKEKPILIIEVLSESTKNFDRGDKLKNYLRIPSLQEYVLVSQKEIEVWIYRRIGKKWEMEILKEDNELHFMSIDLKVPVRCLYVKVFFT
ncbi:MAG: Uma2 family endonuclease [Candidatus Electrothrix sp. AW2]|nr:Uma2 family endonuclease [Candidatus Electrothrix sp. AX1]MCI5118197.1 Uma2 family endonuclease [Candidatus Electrothrix gigas]MCI5135059.1 Uma2 family endonuclease [Candidatus Electrothrix gigas]MCI5182526.1 Uma2 family endonuclease [Candidatus Electrothrix gigas]